MKQKGQSLIELLMAVGLCSILIPALLVALLSTREGRAQQDQRSEALSLLQEGYEAVRSIKENDWTSFAINGIYHPALNGVSWSLVSGLENTGEFTRSIVISDVYRNLSGAIVSSGGTIDPSTKKAVIKVSWGIPYSSFVDLPVYLSRYKTLSYKETTEAEFNQGIKNKVTVTKTDDGEVILGSGGYGNWCEPNLTITAIDLPKSGVANAITAIEGRVFAGTGENASGVSFADVLIDNNATPSGVIGGTFDGFKTNGIFGESNYAYLATDNNAKEVVIIDLTKKDINGKYLESGYFDAPQNKSGTSVYVSGNVGFVTDENKLFTFDLSGKTGSRNKLGEITLSGNGKSVRVKNNYAYVVTDSSNTQLQIVEVKNNGTELTVVGQAQLSALGAKDVFINDSETRAYVATARSDDYNELFIIDISTKTGNRQVLGSYDTGQLDPKSITLATNNKAIIVGIGGENYQVVDTGTETLLTRCGGLTIPTGINGIATVVEQDGDAYSYIITGDTSSELKIIEGGPGGKFAVTGDFESRIFDASSSAAFNKFNTTINKPGSTDLTFKIAIADAVSGSCNNANYIFVGPDGTENTSFATASAIPFNDDGLAFENPGRCMRYKAYLSTTDNNQTPILSDITINYSP